jgi:hypothetical protein
MSSTAALSLVITRPRMVRTRSELDRICPIGPSSSTITAVTVGVLALIVTAGVSTSLVSLFYGRDHLLGLVRLFDLGGERNLATWFASMTLMIGAALTYSLSAGPIEPRIAHGWRCVTVILLALSLDQAADLHELAARELGTAGAAYLSSSGLLVLVVSGFWLVPWLRSFSLMTVLMAASGGAVLVVAAGGLQALMPWVAERFGARSVPHILLAAAAGFLQLAVIVGVILAILRHAVRRRLSVTLCCDDRDSDDPWPQARFQTGPRRVCRVLLFVIGGLTAVSLITQAIVYVAGYPDAHGLARLLNVAREGNLPTWYQTSALLACSILLGAIAVAARRQGDPYATHWLFLALIFLYMSADEGSLIHEMTQDPLRNALGGHGLLYFTWIVVGAAAAALVAGAYYRFVRDLPKATRQLVTAAGAVFVLGALGVEALGGMYSEQFGKANFQYSVLTAIEEGFEMLGIVVFLTALLDYSRDHVGRIVVTPRA